MSRIGKAPITVPSGVDVAVEGQQVTVKGPKGTLSHTVDEPIRVSVDDGVISVARPDDERDNRALHGLSRSLLNNLVQGVSQGYERKLEIHGVGYRVQLQGSTLVFALGFSHPVVFPIPEGIKVAVDAKANRLTVSGIDRQRVGQVAAEIRSLRKPDPYKQKGIRYVGEILKKKAGKAGATGAK